MFNTKETRGALRASRRDMLDVAIDRDTVKTLLSRQQREPWAITNIDSWIGRNS